MNREIVGEKPVRVEYSLTDLGESLEPVIREVAAWGEQHLTEATEREQSIA